MDLSTDPESNQQALCSVTCTLTGDATTGADTGSGISSIGPEIKPCLAASDGELVAKASGATSELDLMNNALSDEGSRHRSEDAPATLSERTYSPLAAIPSVMAQTRLHDNQMSLPRSSLDNTAPPSSRQRCRPNVCPPCPAFRLRFPPSNRGGPWEASAKQNGRRKMRAPASTISFVVHQRIPVGLLTAASLVELWFGFRLRQCQIHSPTMTPHHTSRGIESWGTTQCICLENTPA